MMKRKALYLALILILLISTLLVSGCGDTSKLAGAASLVTDESQTIEEDLATELGENEEEIDEDDEDVYADDETDTDENINTAASDAKTVTVVLNTNKDRKRIHIPDTSCANQIHEENYLKWTGTEDELIEFAKKNGYVACGRCHPDIKLGIDLPNNK